MKVSDNFIRSEFGCRCGCGFNAVDSVLVRTLEEARAYFNKEYDVDVRCHIESGNRCMGHNSKIRNASRKSQHINGIAADHYFYIDGDKNNRIPAQEVYDYYCEKYPNWFGIGLYSNRVHIDARSKPARWRDV